MFRSSFIVNSLKNKNISEPIEKNFITLIKNKNDVFPLLTNNMDAIAEYDEMIEIKNNWNKNLLRSKDSLKRLMRSWPNLNMKYEKKKTNKVSILCKFINKFLGLDSFESAGKANFQKISVNWIDDFLEMKSDLSKFPNVVREDTLPEIIWREFSNKTFIWVPKRYHLEKLNRRDTLLRFSLNFGKKLIVKYEKKE